MSDKEKPYIPIFTKEKFELEKLKNNDLTNFNIFIKSLCEKRNMMIDFEISNAIQSVLSKYGIKTDQISIIEIAQTILILIDHKIDTPEKVYEYIVKHNELQDKATPRRKQKIRAKQYDGKQTNLYKYAMPNMLTSNRICMGSAPKEVENDEYVKALEKIIFTQYTHSHVDNIKSFKNTVNYFEYLEKNKFPYDLLIPLNKKLKDVLK